MLYDLAEEPNEQIDLVAAHPEKVEVLAAQLERSLKEMNAEMPKVNPGFKPSKRVINLAMTIDVTDEHPIFNPECMAIMQEVRKAIRGK